MDGPTVIGIDEAGRGPLAGPVCAAAVLLGPAPEARTLLRDSKKLSPAQRERAARIIKEHAAGWALGWADPGEIDRLNIHHASLLAMTRAFEALPSPANHPSADHPPEDPIIQADGRFPPPLTIPAGWTVEAVIKGDSKVPEIMAASILAKTSRDALMADYAREYPAYGFEKHKGYPTRFHRNQIALYGPCPIHRRSFRLTANET